MTTTGPVTVNRVQLSDSLKKSQTTFYGTVAVAAAVSVLLLATSAVGLEVYNSCADFGTNNEKVKGPRSFLIAMLVISILAILATIAVAVVYYYYSQPIQVLEIKTQ